MRLTLRTALALIPMCAAMGLWACGSSSTSTYEAPVDGGGPPPSDGPHWVDGGATINGDDGGGGEGGGEAGPVNTTVPIKHVVVIIKENHTFDSYFGTFPGAEGTTQPITSNGPITAPHASDLPSDMCHLHSCALADWNGGQMNGWDSQANPQGSTEAYGQYYEGDIPNYWQYARHYTLADHFFQEELGPSFTGHMEFLAAQAGWALDDPSTQLIHPYWGCDQSSSTTVPILDQTSCTIQNVFPCFNIPSLPDILPSGVDWKFYGTDFYVLGEIWTMFDGIQEIRNGPLWNQVVNADQFDSDIDNHQLPAVTWLVDQDLNDEHPGVGPVCMGENWTVGHVNKLMGSDYWKDSVVFFTMDDFGGWYDHVPPPRQYGCDKTNPYGLGFRLPLIIMSPYAKPGYVFKEVSEQASVPRFIEKVFQTSKALSDLDPAAQDGQANDLMNAFDWNQTPNAPLILQTRTCPVP
jgi:phospholipase C